MKYLGRQALPGWDYAEANAFCSSSGTFTFNAELGLEGLEKLCRRFCSCKPN